MTTPERDPNPPAEVAGWHDPACGCDQCEEDWARKRADEREPETMTRYIVHTSEVHACHYEVDASTPEEARAKFERGEYGSWSGEATECEIESVTTSEPEREPDARDYADEPDDRNEWEV